MAATSSERLAQVLIELADTLVADFDLIEFLQMVAARTCELAQVSVSGLLLADDEGRLHFMAASDERESFLHLYQAQADDGPGRDCFGRQTLVISTDLRFDSARWPRFVPLAVAGGFRAAYAFPLRLRQQVIGTLGILSTDTDAMTPADLNLVQALADVATIGLLQERAIHRGELLAEQLQIALASRNIIEQAKGVIAYSYGSTVDEAFDLLRSYCGRNSLRLTQVARIIVTDPENAPDLETR